MHMLPQPDTHSRQLHRPDRAIVMTALPLLTAFSMPAGAVISVREGDDIAAIYNVQPPQPGETPPRAAFVVLARNQDADGVVKSMQRLLRRFDNTDSRSVWQRAAHVRTFRQHTCNSRYLDVDTGFASCIVRACVLCGAHARLACGRHADILRADLTLLRKHWPLRYPWVFLDDGEFNEDFRNATTTAAAGGPTRYGRIPTEHWSYPSWVPEWAAAKARKRQVGWSCLGFRLQFLLPLGGMP